MRKGLCSKEEPWNECFLPVVVFYAANDRIDRVQRRLAGVEKDLDTVIHKEQGGLVVGVTSHRRSRTNEAHAPS